MMNYLIFTVLILCIIAFIDIMLTIKRPLFLRILFLLLVTMIFAINFTILNNNKESILIKFIPIFSTIPGIIFIYITNYIIANTIYKWVKIITITAFLIALLFSLLLFLFPITYSFHNAYVTSFYLLPKFWYFNLFRLSYKIIIAFSLLKLFYEFFITTKSNNLYKSELRRWLYNFFILVVIVFCNIILTMFTHLFITSILFIYSIIFISSALILNIIYRPKIIGYQNLTYNKLKIFDRNEPVTLTDQNFIIPFFENQYYLQKDANLDRFCKENTIDDKEEFQDEIILNYNMTFNNLINKYRVQYLTDLIKSNKYNNYSIDALAQESGFSSRHHLYKPFKKFHGGTPSDFIYYTNN